jgi:hypothetical protein
MSGDVEIFFYSSLSEQQLYALRLGKWYRLSMPRSREVFGREAVEHILSEAPGEISTSVSRDEWKYLLPKEVPHSRHGPDETAHYRANPRRRRNSPNDNRISREHALAAESLLARDRKTGKRKKAFPFKVKLYLLNIRQRDWVGKEYVAEQHPEASRQARRLLIAEVERIRREWPEAKPRGRRR